MKMTKTMTNLEIAALLHSVSAALTLTKGDNRFRIIAYDRAADAIEHASSEVKDLWDDGKLRNIPGIGENIASHLDEIFRTGKSRHFQSLLRPYPPALFELLDIPGVGPKSAEKLCKALGINKAHSAISALEKAARSGSVAKIEGFGEDSQADILRGIQEFRGRSKRLLLPVALKIADELTAWLSKNPNVLRVDPLGSLRRQASTVGDIDLSVATEKPQEIIAHFCAYPRKLRVLEAGDRTASLILPNDYQVDLMVQPPDSYGSLLQHFTGSKHHNIALREYALKKGYSLSEYGIKINGKIRPFDTEEKFYNFLGLDWIPPELREDTGELQAAKSHTLPRLIELKDIQGDLQIHSSFDIEPSHDLGESNLSDLTRTAQKLGYKYIGVTEHNPSVNNHTEKQILDLLKKKRELVYQFRSGSPVYIFNGLEIDIQPDGRRAMPDSGLDFLDYACVGIHSSFRLSRKLMTDRVLAALDHPKIRFLAHPSGRLLGSREGVELDWDRIFDFCLTHHKWLEIDSWPNRLDLPDVLCREAVKNGVKLIINSDSHAAGHLQYLRFGVSVARRGWVATGDIINSQSLPNMHKLIEGGES